MAQNEELSRGLSAAARAAPYLDREQERALAWRWRDAADAKALAPLVAAHMRLAIAVAWRYRRYGLPMPDLVQEGHVGLMEAAARFDPERDVRFATYATWWVRAAIQDYILRNWSIVRGGTSSGQKALFFNLRRVRAKMARACPLAAPSALHDAVAAQLRVSRADVEMMEARLSAPDLSLNAPIQTGDEAPGAERGDFLVDVAPLPDETVAEAIDGGRALAQLRTALTRLNARERRIIHDRRLVEEGATLEELGARLGVSKERVRQIEARALEKLRRLLARPEPVAAL